MKVQLSGMTFILQPKLASRERIELVLQRPYFFGCKYSEGVDYALSRHQLTYLYDNMVTKLICFRNLNIIEGM